MSQISTYDTLNARLMNEQHTWLITGVAGFIGSNLLETLLKLNQRVVGLDNFSTGHQRNLDEVQIIIMLKAVNVVWKLLRIYITKENI